MSVRYQIRDLALADLEEIWLYTLNEWNAVQADAYVVAILDCIEWLAEQPTAGKPRDDIKHGYFCFPVGRHLIFYMVSDDFVDVIGIPHQSMDVIAHFGNAQN